MLSPAFACALLGIGAAAGFLGSLLGLGGGIILVPALVLWLGMDMPQAAATSLIAVIATSNAAASVYVRQGLANLRLGAVLQAATVAGALTGGLTAAYMPSNALIALFGAVLLGVAGLLAGPTSEGDFLEDEPAGPLDGRFYDPSLGRVVRYRFKRLPAALSVSFVAGNLSGLLGIGGGILQVPALHLFSNMPIKAATATSNFMLGMTAAASAVVYFVRGKVDPSLSGVTALGVLAGSLAGAALGPRIKGSLLRRLFAAAAAALAVQMLRRAFSGA